MPGPLEVSFLGAERGDWAVESITKVTGEGLKPVAAVSVLEGPWPFGLGGTWVLRGVLSHEHYVTAVERAELRRLQAPLGRPEATRAALIPLRKSEDWWALAPDERRAVIEERSHHIAEGLRYLPAIARRLVHGRERGEEFDFLAWLEFAPEHTAAFEDLMATLRASEEWRYVDREVDIRLARPPV